MRRTEMIASASAEMEARTAFACNYDEATSFEAMRRSQWWRSQSLFRRCWLLMRGAFARSAQVSH